MGANLQGSSPLQEVRIDKLLAKDKVASARMWLEEVWSKTARRGTRTAYKAQPLDEQAQHGRSPLTRGRVNAAFVRWKFAHLIRGDLRGNVPQGATPPGNRRIERAAAVAVRLWRPRESAAAIVAWKSVKADGAKGQTEEQGRCRDRNESDEVE